MSYSLVYIGATWCKTCKEIKPKTLELAQRFGLPVKILDYDDDLNEEQKEYITKVPTLHILNGNAKFAEYNVNQIASLTAWLTANISLKGDDDF